MYDCDDIFVGNNVDFMNNDDDDDIDNLIEGELIELYDMPKSGNWKFKPLYMDNVNGTLLWQIGYDDNKMMVVIKHGYLKTSKGDKGEIQTKCRPIFVNKSGKSVIEQALSESIRRYINQCKKGYKPGGMEQCRELVGCQPMLASKYRKPDENGKKSNVKRFPVSTMPKLDGIRCLMKKVGFGVEARSRENNIFIKFEHIKKQLLDFFYYLPENSELDGEIYSMNMTLPQLASIVKTVTKIHPLHDELRYYIFDIIEPERQYWPHRYEMLKMAYKKYTDVYGTNNINFELVPHDIVMNHDEIILNHKKYVSQGYEGLIIRHCLGLKASKKDMERSKYKPKRSNNLLKYKEFVDEEVEIIGGEVCVGTEEGAVRFKVRYNDKEFFVRPRGSIEQRRIWYENIDNLIGKKLTIRYQELSEYGVPRFPVGISIRDYE